MNLYVLSKSSPQQDNPVGSKINLFPHQKALLRRISDIENSSQPVYAQYKLPGQTYGQNGGLDGMGQMGMNGYGNYGMGQMGMNGYGNYGMGQMGMNGYGNYGMGQMGMTGNYGMGQMGMNGYGVGQQQGEQQTRVQGPPTSSNPQMTNQNSTQMINPQMANQNSTHQTTIKVGIMSDPPGSGKSYVLLAHMLQEKKTKGQTQNLLVIPANIHEQWVTYCKNFSEDLVVYSFIDYADISRLYADWSVLSIANLIITTSTNYKIITDIMTNINQQFNRVILDEIDSIQNWISGVVPANIIWFVSASFNPKATGIFTIDEKALDRCTAVCRHDFIDESISLPKPLSTLHKCHCPYSQILSQDILTKKELGYMNAMDFTSFRFNYETRKVNDIQELITTIFADKTKELLSLDDSHDQLCRNLREYDHNMLGAKSVRIAQELREVMSKREQVQKKVDTLAKRLNTSGSCPMCLKRYSQNHPQATVPCCQNSFCQECIVKHLRRGTGCPICRQRVTENQLKLADPSSYTIAVATTAEGKLASKNKYAVLSDIISEQYGGDGNGNRFMVFSDYDGTFMKVRDMLDKDGIPYAELDGADVKKLTAAVQRYRDGQSPVLLVDSKQYGAGLNLECTSHVILLHELDKKREAQVIGRAQRFGRKGPLKIFKLVYPHETAA